MIRTSRRVFVTGIAGFAIAGTSLHLRSAYAEEPETVTIQTPSGRNVTAYLSIPATVPAPAVVLIHASYGLTDFYRSLATTYSEQGFVALSVDLYDGKVTTSQAEALNLVGIANANRDVTTETLVTWIDWLKADARTTKKVAVIGWSFGAHWALITASVVALDAVILYYGGTDTWGLKGLKAPVLGHFAERDTDPRPYIVRHFAAEMAKAGKTLDLRWYAADHSFANPTHPRYDKIAAEASWQATLAFLHANLD